MFSSRISWAGADRAKRPSCSRSALSPNFFGTSHLVAGSGVLLVSIAPPQASGTGVAQVLDSTMSPTVRGGAVGKSAKIQRIGGDLIGAMETGVAGSGMKTLVEIGLQEMCLKGMHGLGGIVLVAPFFAGSVKQSSGEDDVVTVANDSLGC